MLTLTRSSPSEAWEDRSPQAYRLTRLKHQGRHTICYATTTKTTYSQEDISTFQREVKDRMTCQGRKTNGA